jgi:hypothetical protein
MFKKLGKAVKKFANTTIGKIVIGTALFMVAGPAAASMLGASAGGAAAAGISGFVSGAGTSLLAGGNLKDSLKAGAIGGITAGVSKGVMNRMGTPAAAAPEIAQQPLRPLDLSVPRGDALPLQSISPAQAAVNIPPGGIGSLPVATGPTAVSFTPSLTGAEQIQDILAQASRVTAPIQPPASSGMGFPRTTAAPGTLSPGTTVDLGALDRASPTLKTPGYTSRTEVAATGGSSPRNLLQQGGDRLQEFYSDKLSPDRFDAAAAKAGEKAFDDTFAQYGGNRLVQGTDAHTTAITKANEAKAAAIASNTPGPFRQFAPIAATGLGIMALTGGFKEEEVAPPEGFEEFMLGSPGERYLEQNPDQRIRYGGAYTTSTTPQFNPYSYTPPPRAAAKGGSMDKEFPRKTGPINGPGTGTSDDIPAMLSDGEFVFTAKAVRNMGDGSRRKGAQRMYALMRKLEGRKNG